EMRSERAPSISRFRAALAQHRQAVLSLVAIIAFYSLGGEEALRAAQVTHERWQQDRRALLLSAGVAPERLPAPEPMPLAASAERVAGRVGSGVEVSGKWLLEQGEQLVAAVGEKIAA